MKQTLENLLGTLGALEAIRFRCAEVAPEHGQGAPWQVIKDLAA